MVDCFFEAHCTQSGLESKITDTTKSYCTEIVKKAFKDTGGDYESPTKESILACLRWLAKYSTIFRDQAVIQKHMGEIMELVKLIK